MQEEVNNIIQLAKDADSEYDTITMSDIDEKVCKLMFMSGYISDPYYEFVRSIPKSILINDFESKKGYVDFMRAIWYRTQGNVDGSCRYYLQSANKNNLCGMTGILWYYEYTKGCNRLEDNTYRAGYYKRYTDDDKMIEIFQKLKSAANNSQFAAFVVGRTYRYGFGICDKNIKLSLEYYSMLNENSYLICYIDGLESEVIKQLIIKNNIIIKLRNENKYLEDKIIELEYRPLGPGYEQAKQEFESFA